MNYLNAIACGLTSFALFYGAREAWTAYSTDTKKGVCFAFYLASLVFAAGAILNLQIILK